MQVAQLPTKQERFVEEYLIDLNATAAAIRAGYSAKTAHVQGPRLLSNVRVRARVDECLAEISTRTGVTVERIERELARIAFVNPGKVVNFSTADVLSKAS